MRAAQKAVPPAGERVFDIMTGTVVISGVTIQNGKAFNEMADKIGTRARFS